MSVYIDGADALATDNLYINSAYNGNLTDIANVSTDEIGKNSYNYIKQIADYLFEVQYSTENIDYDYANSYFKNINSNELDGAFGACTGIYKSGKVLRQFDYYYDNNAEFIVKRVADPEAENYINDSGIHASIGVASGVIGLTKSVVESGKYHKKYDLLPFDMTDGINDAGVYIQVNVVPLTYKNPTSGEEITVSYNINPNATHKCAAPMVIRYILDHCTSFEDVEYFFNNTNIYATSAIKFGFHYLIVINNVWKIFELTSDGHITVTEGTGENQLPHGIMTNFRTYGLEFNNDTLDWESIEGYGLGVERYEIAQTAFNSSNPVSLETLRSSLKYSHFYSDTPQTWKTELCGDEVPDESGHKLTVKDVKDNTYSTKVATMLSNEKTNYTNATRDNNNGVWKTTHSAIYDLSTKSFNLAIQERMSEIFVFCLNEPSDFMLVRASDDSSKLMKLTVTSSGSVTATQY